MKQLSFVSGPIGVSHLYKSSHVAHIKSCLVPAAIAYGLSSPAVRMVFFPLAFVLAAIFVLH